SLNAAFQQAPEVFESIGMHPSTNVLNGMVNHLMLVFLFESIIGSKCVCVNCGPSRDMPLYFALKNTLAAIFNYGSSDFPATLQDSHNCGLVFSAGSGDAPLALVMVHITSLSTNERFVNFDLSIKLL